MKVVIFGTARSASLAWYCLAEDSDHEVVGFAVDGEHQDCERLHDLPVHPFETLERVFPPDSVAMLIPAGFQRINGFRRERYLAAKQRGYGFVSYVSSRAITWPDLRLGENCMIYEGAIVQPFAVIGDNTIIRSGVHVSHHNTIGSHCFLAPRAALAGGVVIADECVVGVNATIRDDTTVARRSFIAAGALVVRDTQPDGLYKGAPARRDPRSLKDLGLA